MVSTFNKLKRREVWGLEQSLCGSKPHGQSPLLPQQGRAACVQAGRQEPWLLPSFSRVPIREAELPLPRFIRYFQFLHLTFISSTSPLSCLHHCPPPSTEADRFSCLSIQHLWASYHLDTSSIFSTLASLQSGLHPATRGISKLIRACHFPAQNPPWLSITPGIKCRLLGLAFRIPAQLSNLI